MEQAEFLAALEAHLKTRADRFSRRCLVEFVRAAWPLIEDNPDVLFWAGEFLEAGRATA
jgi:hypothetical protein